MNDIESVDASNYEDSSVERITSLSPSQLERTRISPLRVEGDRPFSGILSNQTPEGSDELDAQEIENRIQARVAAAMEQEPPKEPLNIDIDTSSACRKKRTIPKSRRESDKSLSGHR